MARLFEKRIHLPGLETNWLSLYSARSEFKDRFTEGKATVTLRCVLDGLLLYAKLCPEPPQLLAFDGDESFALEAIEALYYEIVAATREEVLVLEIACFRLLRRAADFRQVEDGDPTST